MSGFRRLDDEAETYFGLVAPNCAIFDPGGRRGQWQDGHADGVTKYEEQGGRSSALRLMGGIYRLHHK
jgi:hypothetical protein